MLSPLANQTPIKNPLIVLMITGLAVFLIASFGILTRQAGFMATI